MVEAAEMAKLLAVNAAKRFIISQCQLDARSFSSSASSSSPALSDAVKSNEPE